MAPPLSAAVGANNTYTTYQPVDFAEGSASSSFDDEGEVAIIGRNDNNDAFAFIPSTLRNDLYYGNNKTQDIIKQSNWMILLVFGSMGLLNNISYVIMLASAKAIMEGGTAVIFLSASVPSLLVKMSAPIWIDRISTNHRIMTAAVCMGVAFLLVAIMSLNSSDANNDAADGSNHDDHSSTSYHHILGQLLGVALISVQGGLGEASLLALAGSCDYRMCHHQVNNDDSQEQPTSPSRYGRDNGNGSSATTTKTKGICITAFSSGTGLAGPAGYLYKIALTDWFGFSLQTMCALATLLAVMYGGLYTMHLSNSVVVEDVQQQQQCEHHLDNSYGSSANDGYELSVLTAEERPIINNRQKSVENQHSDNSHPPITVGGSTCSQRNNVVSSSVSDRDVTRSNNHHHDRTPTTINSNSEGSYPIMMKIADMTSWQRFRLVVSLWQYIIPLFTVYAAEYACQAGAWTAIGFPSVNDPAARARFYQYSNALYQVGVFLSRSSGTLCTLSMGVLWLLPGLQVLNLIMFSKVAANPHRGILYRRPVLYFASFYTGILGGSVYVHAYKRIVADQKAVDRTEFALASVSVADNLGIIVADVLGLFLQACLYAANGSGTRNSCFLSVAQTEAKRLRYTEPQN